MTAMAPLTAHSTTATFTAFLAFHHQLAAVRQRLAALGPAEIADERALAAEVFAHLKSAVMGASDDLERSMGDPHADPRYVMAALADEMMLHEVDWPGRGWWADNLLEQHLFRSSICGEKLFRLARDLVDGKLPGRTDLAMAILLALSLGFRGRYRGIDDGGVILTLRQRLYQMLYHRPPPRDIDWAEAMPDLAVPALAPSALRRQRAPSLRPWLLLILALLAGYTLVAHGLWHGTTADLIEGAQAIVTSRAAP